MSKEPTLLVPMNDLVEGTEPVRQKQAQEEAQRTRWTPQDVIDELHLLGDQQEYLLEHSFYTLPGVSFISAFLMQKSTKGLLAATYIISLVAMIYLFTGITAWIWMTDQSVLPWLMWFLVSAVVFASLNFTLSTISSWDITSETRNLTDAKLAYLSAPASAYEMVRALTRIKNKTTTISVEIKRWREYCLLTFSYTGDIGGTFRTWEYVVLGWKGR